MPSCTVDGSCFWQQFRRENVKQVVSIRHENVNEGVVIRHKNVITLLRAIGDI